MPFLGDGGGIHGDLLQFLAQSHPLNLMKHIKIGIRRLDHQKYGQLGI
jgi:hypothetical protein